MLVVSQKKSTKWTCLVCIWFYCVFLCLLYKTAVAAHLVGDSRWPGWVGPQGWHRSKEAAPAEPPPHHETPPAAHIHSGCQLVVWKSHKSHAYTHAHAQSKLGEELTRLWRISSLANSNEQEEMSIRFFNSAYEYKREHRHQIHLLKKVRKVHSQHENIKNRHSEILALNIMLHL